MSAYHQSENLEIKLDPRRILGIMDSIDKYCHEETKRHMLNRLEGKEYAVTDWSLKGRVVVVYSQTIDSKKSNNKNIKKIVLAELEWGADLNELILRIYTNKRVLVDPKKLEKIVRKANMYD